jgi:hypothetical protein
VLPSCNWFVKDKVLFLDGQVLDERNMPGKTLGVRRLQSGREDLVTLKKAITNIQSLISCKTKFFIDFKGNPFIYEKNLTSKLVCYRILRVDIKDKQSLLWLRGVPTPFTIPRPPSEDVSWARVLHIGDSPFMLYDYASYALKTTYRRI